ncbi:hypothetical protein CJ030_MR8G004366 [Morella rubra]|uniref:RPW8 domain-containing protein n=1 Tax=Morella rubra TaxID=262757 RepID=A0A6A1URX5_9ROSI|nr:hypothetical protein CJ030_MR8G004366 [Morella rubra]
MAGALGSAVLGKEVSKLDDTVDIAIQTTPLFEAVLELLRFTLAALKPAIEEIQRSHGLLGRREEEIEGLIEQIIKGENHVRNYSKLPWWKYLKRYSYAKKLCALDHELIRSFHLDVQAWDWRNGAETLLGLTDILARMSLAEWKGGCANPGPPEFSVGLEKPLWELKMRLLKEEVSLLLLTAPEGCGKTTLVKLLCHDEDIKDIYKGNLFFVTVSKTPDLKFIIQTLFDQKGDRVLEFQSDKDAINNLEHLLKQIADPILLILDDVWSDSFVKKFEFPIPNYKILVASRIAFPGYKFRYKLRQLDDEDSMTLFRRSADLTREEDVKKIVAACGGHPQVTKMMGTSLRGRPAADWRRRAMNIHDSVLQYYDDDNCCPDSDDDNDNWRLPISSLHLDDDEIMRRLTDRNSDQAGTSQPTYHPVKIWHQELDDVFLLDNGFYVFKMKRGDTCLAALKGSPYRVLSNPLCWEVIAKRSRTMAEALGSAVLGKAVSKLYDRVENVIETTLSFEAALDRLKSTLAALKPVIEEIENSHRELGRQEKETEGLIEQISKGENHVEKYSKLPWWKYLKRNTYAKKLCKLDQELIRFFQLKPCKHGIEEIGTGTGLIETLFEVVGDIRSGSFSLTCKHGIGGTGWRLY